MKRTVRPPFSARTSAQPPAADRILERPPGSQPRGAIIVEFILAFCVLFILTLALFQFGIILLVHQTLTTTAIEGAREAAKVGASGPGDTIEELADTVVEHTAPFLAIHCIEIPPSGGPDDPEFPNAHIIVERFLVGGAEETAERGDLTIPCSPPAAVDPIPEGTVRVTICVPLTDGKQPTPDFLPSFGFSLSDCIFQVSSLAELE